MNRLVYLAGPITGLSFEGATDWREWAKRELADVGLVGLSPLRAKNYLAGVKKIDDAYPDFGMSTEQAITARDRFDCQRAGMVIFNFLGAEKASVGSCIEVGWADSARVPSILVLEDPHEVGDRPEALATRRNVHDHAMVRTICGWRTNSLSDAVNIAKAVLLP